MVVGTYVEVEMVLAVVPTDTLAIVLDHFRATVADAGSYFSVLDNLSQQPASRYDCMSF